MRIELPAAAWTDATHRAEDDAHTLTVALPLATHWTGEGWTAGPACTLRTEVHADPSLPLTLTLTP